MTPPKKSDLACAKAILDDVPRAMRAVRTELRSHTGLDLTVPQFRVLVHTARRPRSNGDLAELQGVSRSAMSRMVDSMIERGLVSREPSATDQRSVIISLTARGREIYETMRQKAQKRFAQVLSTFSDTDKASLNAGLAVLKAFVAAYDEMD